MPTKSIKTNTTFIENKTSTSTSTMPSTRITTRRTTRPISRYGTEINNSRLNDYRNVKSHDQSPIAVDINLSQQNQKDDKYDQSEIQLSDEEQQKCSAKFRNIINEKYQQNVQIQQRQRPQTHSGTRSKNQNYQVPIVNSKDRIWEQKLTRDIAKHCNINTKKMFFDINIKKLHRDFQRKEDYAQVSNLLISRLSKYNRKKTLEKSTLEQMQDFVHQIKKTNFLKENPKIKNETTDEEIEKILKFNETERDYVKYVILMKKQLRRQSQIERQNLQQMQRGWKKFDNIFQSSLQKIVNSFDELRAGAQKNKQKYKLLKQSSEFGFLAEGKILQ